MDAVSCVDNVTSPICAKLRWNVALTMGYTDGIKDWMRSFSKWQKLSAPRIGMATVAGDFGVATVSLWTVADILRTFSMQVWCRARQFACSRRESLKPHYSSSGSNRGRCFGVRQGECALAKRSRLRIAARFKLI
jgi:hypothetical protein